MDMKQFESKAKEIAVKHAKAGGKEMILEVLLPMAKMAVEASENKWDDMAYAAMESSVKQFIEGL